MTRGGLGARSLNLALQRALNPPGEARVERFGRVFSVGDKVMPAENDDGKDVSNGDLGSIARIDPERGSVVIDVEGREVAYDVGDLIEVVPAYATTVPKAPGAGDPAVVIPRVTQHYAMLRRNLVDTAVTRGKKLVVGQPRALALAVRGAHGWRQWSKLSNWLVGEPEPAGRSVTEAAG